MNVITRKYLKFIRWGGRIPKMFNPYNCREITDYSPAITTNCGSTDSSSTVLVIRCDDERIFHSKISTN